MSIIAYGLFFINMFFALHVHTQPTMHTREYFTHLFAADPVTTEYDAYKLLKANPVQAEINYLAIPWAALINRKKLDQVPDIYLDGGFTICQHIEYEAILPILEKIGVDTLFTPHAKKSGNSINSVTVLPFPHAAVHGITPGKKNILYSFIGMNNHLCRDILFKLPAKPDAVIKQRKNWHWWADKKQQNQEQREYQNVLARSRFSLCPRGTGPSTLRFWESLQAGAIPVHISHEGMLPSGFDWSTCVVEVPEQEAHTIDRVIRSIIPEQEQHMREQCLQAYAQFSGHNFTRVIHDYYKEQRS